MKKEHYYLTLAIGKLMGIPHDTIEQIAWADQFVDECNGAKFGIQTQIDFGKLLGGNWGDPMIQRDVIVPFHFLSDRPDGLVTPNNSTAIKLMGSCKANEPIRIGVSLHGFQDTFFHQDFTGFEQDINSGLHFRNGHAALVPNIGHADYGSTPDILEARWYHFRLKKNIDNRRRAMQCARHTYKWLKRFYGTSTTWKEIRDKLKPVFRMKYADRKRALLEMAGPEARALHQAYPTKKHPWTEWMWYEHKPQFLKAAALHQAEALRIMKPIIPRN